MFWKIYPHARAWKKNEAQKYFSQQDSVQVFECVKLYVVEVKMWIQNISFVPACQKWIRDFVYSEHANKAKLFWICEKMIKDETPVEEKRQLASDFEKYNVPAIFKEIRNRKTDLLINSIINGG